MIRRPALVALAALALAVNGCGGDDTPVATASFEVRPGVEIVTVTGAEPRIPLTLYGGDGEPLVTLITDALGQAHFSYVPFEHLTIDTIDGVIPVIDGTTLKKGDGYVIRNDTDPADTSAPFSVLGVHDVPDPALYERQSLVGVNYSLFTGDGPNPDEGFQYIEVRDGVKLGVMVRFPDKLLWGNGPWPTVIEYSGYATSRPGSPDAGSRIATLFGYASVGVNMRGTGCSGGVFDVFNPAQHADGYDVVEVVARQPWVLHNKVGMVGLSYSGIAQLFVASTRPPSLAAITPLSVIADPWEQQWPGGVYNAGFTRQWLEQRDAQAAPGGQSWTDDRIAAGDEACAAHQELRQQNIDFQSFFRAVELYPPAAVDRSLPRLVEDIEVPVYLTGAWQDEQTGPQFADMLDRFTSVPTAKFTLFNGRHPDGYSPLVLSRWLEFLALYVGQRVPRLDEGVRNIAGPELSKEFGVEGLGLEPDRFPEFDDDDHAGVKAAYESEPRARVLFESGAAGPEPGAPAARFEASFDAWPPPDVVARDLYFGPQGTLTDTPPSAPGVDAYTHDPDAGSSTFLGPAGYQILEPLWDIDWTRFAEGQSLSYLTAPFEQDAVLAGPGFAELFFASEADDATVQITLTEVRPDDTEYLIQSGWLRLGHRHFTDAPDGLRLVRSYLAEDFEPLVPGQRVAARVAISSVAHALRAGSRLRVIVSTPGRNHALWEFESPDYGGDAPVHTVARSPGMASRLHLPFVTGVQLEEGFPPCPSLRGQPCRDYLPSTNTAAD